MLVFDDGGDHRYCDIVLTEAVEGVGLDSFIREKCDLGEYKTLESVRRNWSLMCVDLLRSDLVHNRIKPQNIIVGGDLSCMLRACEAMAVPAMDNYTSSVNNDIHNITALAVLFKMVASNPEMLRLFGNLLANGTPFTASGLIPLFRSVSARAGSAITSRLLDIVGGESVEREELAALLEEYAHDRSEIRIGMADVTAMPEEDRKIAGNPAGKDITLWNYDDIFPMEESLHSMSKNEKWGYVDDSGEWIIEAVYDWADDFAEGRAVVIRDGCYGLIDKKGNEIIPAVYEDVVWNCEESVVLAVEEGRVGVFDRNGNNTVLFTYGYAGDISCGLIAVRHASKLGYINKHGDVVMDFIFDYASDFINGSAMVIHGGVSKTLFTSGKMADPYPEIVQKQA